MPIERDRQTILRFFREVVGGGDLALLDELATEDYDDRAAFPGQKPGRAGLKERIAVIRAAFRPRHVLHDVLVDGDLAAVRWTLSGIHSGPFGGLAATGVPVEIEGIDVYRLRGGRLAAHWNVVDLLAFHRQAGPHARTMAKDQKEERL